MDSHIYTRELLDKHRLSELKEIAQCFSLIPEGNKAHRETWISALVGMPFPAVRLIDYQHQEPIENPPAVDPGADFDRAEEPIIEAVEASPGADRVEEPIELPDEKSLDVDRAQESVEFPDLESALAEIARLRAQNQKLMELARSQSEIIRRAKDVSPVARPSRCRVARLAGAAFMNVSKAFNGGWVLSMGEKLKRGFKTLKEIWELLIADDWLLSDIFSPPLPAAKKSLFSAAHSKYSAIPFSDDDLIDIWSLRVNAVSSGRSPPGGEAM